MCIPQLLKNWHFLKLIIFAFGVRGIYGALREPIELSFIKNGIDKVEMSTIQTMVLPIALVAYYISSKFLQPENLLRRLYVIAAVTGSTLFLRYLALQRLIATKNKESAYLQLLILGIIDVIKDFRITFFFAYCMKIIDPKYGATVVTFLMAVWNLSDQIPQTIGLKIIDHISFSTYNLSLFTLFVVIMIFIYPLATHLDLLDPSKYVFTKLF